MSKFENKEIIKVLEESLMGEYNTKCKYIHFAKKAEEEKYPLISKLFKAVAFAEYVHFNNFLHALCEIKKKDIPPDKYKQFSLPDFKIQINKTNINLLNARVTESFEFTKKYRDIYKKAANSGISSIIKSIERTRLAEKSHASLFSSYIKDFDEGKLIDHDFYICTKCGNVAIKHLPEICEICKETKDTFERYGNIKNDFQNCLTI